MLVNNISNDGVEDGVAQEFETFVIQRPPFFRTDGSRLVQERLFVKMNIARIESKYLIKTKIRLSVLTEQEPYLVYLIS